MALELPLWSLCIIIVFGRAVPVCSGGFGLTLLSGEGLTPSFPERNLGENPQNEGLERPVAKICLVASQSLV